MEKIFNLMKVIILVVIISFLVGCGVAENSENYTISFDCSFPKSFSCFNGDVIIESISWKHEWGSNSFTLYWTGRNGDHDRYSGSSRKKVGFKLYDPIGNLIDDGIFYTDSMSAGDSFRGKESFYVGNRKCKMKGEYKMKLLNVE